MVPSSPVCNEGWINAFMYIIEFETVTSCHWSFSERQRWEIFTVESHLHELLSAVAAAELRTICHEGSREERWNSSPSSFGKHWHRLHGGATGSFTREVTAPCCSLLRNDRQSRRTKQIRALEELNQQAAQQARSCCRQFSALVVPDPDPLLLTKAEPLPRGASSPHALLGSH